MSKILPVSDLRNNNERDKAEKKLLLKLQEAEDAVRDENNWMTLDDLKATLKNNRATASGI